MPKAEISWKRVTEDGEKLQVYVQHIGREWKFFQREKRFDVWQPVKEPPLEDWMALLDAMTRLVNRRRYQPDDETLLRRQIRERFPEAGI
jgi:GGDEF domain-containing protein